METTVNANHLSAAVHRFPAIGQSRQPSRLKRFRSAAPRTRCSISSKKSNYQGQWRLGGVNLTLIHARKDTSEQNEEDRNPFFGLRYDFETDEFLLGEGSENSMVELRPSSVTELSLSDSSASMTSEVTQSMSLQSNEESMKAYADLKLSLLLYDSILIFSGTAIASFLAGDEAAFAFLFGGISGFLYLLLLQRSVDGLPSPASASSETKGNFEQMFEGFRSPVSGLAFVIGLTILALKYGSNDPQLSLTPKDLLVGLMGFLTCKVAVLLAAFKPMPIRWNK